jgi:hypothetical protein
MRGLEAAIRFTRGNVGISSRTDGRTPTTAARNSRSRIRAYGRRMSAIYWNGATRGCLRELADEPAGRAGPSTVYEAPPVTERNVGDDQERAINSCIRSSHLSRVSGRPTPHPARPVLSREQDPVRCPACALWVSSMLNPSFTTAVRWLESEGKPESRRPSITVPWQALTDATARSRVPARSGSRRSDRTNWLLFSSGVIDRSLQPECRKLLDCSRRLNRHDVSSRVCRELREAGETDPRIIQTEISILQLYDPEEALRVAQVYLAKRPADRQVALWQSTLSLRLDRRDLLISDLSRLPFPDQLTPGGTGLSRSAGLF